VPAFFSGANSLLFHIAGLVHPRLRTALLPHELLNKRERQIELRVGHTVPAKKIASYQTDEELTAHLRERSYWLGERGKRRPFVLWKPKEKLPVAERIQPQWLADEIAGLPAGALLAETADFQVLTAIGQEIPTLLLEIGAERERTFRQAGEGTGQPRDLDRFDRWYRHIILWHKERQVVAGAYRICGTDAAQGGLYTETLFRYQPEFFRRIGTALELGRSFVAPEFQKSFQPLLLLWKGIGAYIVRNPRYRFLFGPVSISNEYQTASRDLMAAYLRCAALDTALAPLVSARRPFQSTPHRHLLATRDIDEIESAVSDLEPDAKGIPVLVRQYLRLGGRIAALHVDKGFGETLDGLVVMDLLRADQKALERYLGPVGLASFLAAQGSSETAA
jgi:putative hemolysin